AKPLTCFLWCPQSGQTSGACLANVERSNIKEPPQRCRLWPCRGCPVGLPQQRALACEQVTTREELTALASLAFTVVFTFPWPSLNRRPAATFHRPTQMP